MFPLRAPHGGSIEKHSTTFLVADGGVCHMKRPVRDNKSPPRAPDPYDWRLFKKSRLPLTEGACWGWILCHYWEQSLRGETDWRGSLKKAASTRGWGPWVWCRGPTGCGLTIYLWELKREQLSPRSRMPFFLDPNDSLIPVAAWRLSHPYRWLFTHASLLLVVFLLIPILGGWLTHPCCWLSGVDSVIPIVSWWLTHPYGWLFTHTCLLVVVYSCIPVVGCCLTHPCY